MDFPFFVARRYLFSKKTHNTINIISGISVFGVALATMALVCTMSVFNGFRDLIGSLYTAFDPQLEIVPAKGKFAPADDPAFAKVKGHKEVEAVSACLEDNALILFQQRPIVVTIKGVDENFERCTGIRNILYGRGSYLLSAGGINYGIPGIGLAQQLGGVDYGKLLIGAPRKGEEVNMMNPGENFTADELVSPGVVFSVSQRKYDDNYIIAPLQFAQNLFEQQGLVTALEVKLKDGADAAAVKEELKAELGSRYNVLDRMEQQESLFGIMNIEKLMAYLFLTFILLVACFNIVGSVSMLIVDKREDAATLRNLGISERGIVKIFLYEGRLITVMGAAIGIALGLLLCLLQQTYGFLKLGSSSGNFIVDAYPVSVHYTDIALIFITVLVVGFTSVWYPVHHLSKRLTRQ